MGRHVDPGFYPSLPNESYQASAGVSVSRLKRFAEAPAKARVQRPETTALRLGSLIHTAVLEAGTLDQRYVPTRLERRGTAAWEKLEALHPGKEVVKQDDYDTALRIRDAILSHSAVAREVLTPALEVEGSFYWTDAETGLLRRGRADGIHRPYRLLMDIKSTEDASPGAFAHTCRAYRYDWQDGWYRDGIAATLGWQPEGFFFIAVEKEEPWLCKVYEISPHQVDEGRQEVAQMLRDYAECERSGVWPGYGDGVEVLDLPARARMRH